MSRFCAKCGIKYDGKIPFIDNLCLKCYLEEHKLLSIKGEIVLEICKVCNAIKYGGKWVGSGSDLLENIYATLPSIITEKSRVLFEGTKIYLHLPEAINYRFNVEIDVEINIGGTRASQKYIVPVQIKPTVCPRCQKKLTGIHKAIIQIRSSKPITPAFKRFIHKYLMGLEEKYKKDIVEIKDLKEGIDIKLLSFTVARAIANKFRVDLGATIKETHKLIGRKNGKKETLMTISVRLPAVIPGDYILYDDNLYLVKDMKHGHLVIESTISNETTSIPITLIWKEKIRVIDKVVPETLIYLMKEGNLAYLVCESNPQKTYIIPCSKLPPSAREGCKIKVLVIDGKPYVLEVL